MRKSREYGAFITFNVTCPCGAEFHVAGYGYGWLASEFIVVHEDHCASKPIPVAVAFGTSWCETFSKNEGAPLDNPPSDAVPS